MPSAWNQQNSLNNNTIEVNSVISNKKKVFLKAPLIEKLPCVPLPPQLIPWGTWLNAALLRRAFPCYSH